MKTRMLGIVVALGVLISGLVGCGTPPPKRDLPYTSEKKLARWQKERESDMRHLEKTWCKWQHTEWGARKYADNAIYPVMYQD